MGSFKVLCHVRHSTYLKVDTLHTLGFHAAPCAHAKHAARKPFGFGGATKARRATRCRSQCTRSSSQRPRRRCYSHRHPRASAIAARAATHHRATQAWISPTAACRNSSQAHSPEHGHWHSSSHSQNPAPVHGLSGMHTLASGNVAFPSPGLARSRQPPNSRTHLDPPF